MLKIISICLFLWPLVGHAQFTYFGAGPSFTMTKFAKGVNHRALNLNLSVMSRPLRNVGVGLSLGLPVSQGNSFSLRRSTGNSFEPDFELQTQEYTIRNGLQSTIAVRLFFGGQMNWYADMRINFNKFTEELILFRAEIPWDYYYNFPGAPILSISDRTVVQSIYPGIFFGAMSHLQKQLYLDLNIGVDILSLQGYSDIHSIPYGRSSSMGQLKYTTLASPLYGTKTALSTNLGIGYYF